MTYKAAQITGERCQCLQQQSRFTDTRIAADQHHRAGDQAATEHAVKFFDGGRYTRLKARLHLTQGLYLRAGVTGVPGKTGGSATGGSHRQGFRQAVPGTAIGALPGPLG